MTFASLVTGASAGIGTAFAHALAARGHRLMLTARREDRLRTLADELARAHGTDSLVVPLDLAAPDAAATLCDRLDEAGWSIDWLVNNAGYGVPGMLDESDWLTHAAFLRVMVEAPTELVHRLLPGMRARRFGRIVNVASLAGLVPGSAGHTLYGASKAYLVSFSQSLALENAEAGVHATALCPGFTRSEFHDVTGTRDQVRRLPGFLWQDADEVVREGIAAVEAGKPVHVTGRVNRAIRTLAGVMPDRLTLAISRSQSRRFRKERG